MGGAAHRQIARSLASTERVRKLMMQLEKSGLATACTRLVDEAALEPIPLPHFASHGSRAALATLARNAGSFLASFHWKR